MEAETRRILDLVEKTLVRQRFETRKAIEMIRLLNTEKLAGATRGDVITPASSHGQSGTVIPLPVSVKEGE